MSLPYSVTALRCHGDCITASRWMSRGGQVTNPTRQQTGIRPDLFRNPIFRSIFVAGALAEALKIIGFKPVLSCFDHLNVNIVLKIVQVVVTVD